jgi:hypothetical protein
MGGKVNKMKWYEAETGNHQGLIIDEETGENIAIAYDKANARLIASGPELLEALKTAQVRIFMLEGASDEYEKARAVIAQAEGRE